MTTPDTARGRGIRQPLPKARARRAFDPRAAARRRRRRLLVRFVPSVLLGGLALMGLGQLAGRGAPAPAAEVAVDIRDQVKRMIVERTDDYSAAVGPLDCVELRPGKGNCLADVKLAGHRSDRVMVAVTYVDTGGAYDLLVKMP